MRMEQFWSTTWPVGKLMRLVCWSKARSEEHTSEPQSPCNLVCRLLLEKKNKPLLADAFVSPDADAAPVTVLLLRFPFEFADYPLNPPPIVTRRLLVYRFLSAHPTCAAD